MGLLAIINNYFFAVTFSVVGFMSGSAKTKKPS
jgi:hypothetical protein